MRTRPQALRAIEDLYRLYARFNKKYFGGNLPKEVRLVIVPMGKRGYSIDTTGAPDLEVGCTTMPENPEALPTVEINDLTLLDPNYARMVMMHEMIHVGGVLDHGATFKKEIDRVSRLGFLREIL